MADANNTAPTKPAHRSISIDVSEQIQGCIKLLNEKIGRISACHASLLALANQFDHTDIPTGPEGRLCPEFVFPALLNSISPDLEGISPVLWDLEDLLEKLETKKERAQ